MIEAGREELAGNLKLLTWFMRNTLYSVASLMPNMQVGAEWKLHSEIFWNILTELCVFFSEGVSRHGGMSLYKVMIQA